jgi:hypothetical protein
LVVGAFVLFLFCGVVFFGHGGYRCRASLGLARRLRALLVGCLLERGDVLGAAGFVMVCFVLFRLVEFVWWV